MPPTEEQTVVSVLPFGIEADHPRNSDLLLQSIPGERLRSAVDGSKGVEDAKTGDYRVPLDQSRALASFPKTPGMQIHVNPEKLAYKIIDPLKGDEKTTDRVSRFLQEAGILGKGEKVDGVPPKEGKLDVHRMKTLCRELLNIVKAGQATRVAGVIPTLEDIDELPGKYLLNPGSRVPNTQPIYEEDMEEWVSNLSRSGG